MKHLQLLLLLLLPLSLQAGSWQYFPFANTYRRVQCAGDEVFILKGNRLIEANGPQWSFVREHTRLNGLSDSSISDIAYSSVAHKLAIAYSNGLIDILHADGSINTLTDLKEATFAGQSKHINSITECVGMLCVSTDFGFLTVDLQDEIIRDCLSLGTSVTHTWIEDGHYYYRTPSGQTFTAPITANLYNPQNWTKTSALPSVPSLPSGAIDQCPSVTGDTIYTLYPEQGLVSNIHAEALEVEQYQLGEANNRLTFTHGTLAATHISDITFGSYVVNLQNNGYLSEYNPTTDQWDNIDHQDITSQLTARKVFHGIMTMISDPATPHRYYFSTLEDGIYVVQDGILQSHWDCHDPSAGVEAFVGQSTRISGMAVSPQGDLWFLNEGVSELMRVHTADNHWYKYTIPGAEEQISMPRMIQSQHGNTLWGCRIAGYEKCFVFAYDHGGTASDGSDDRSVMFYKLTDQDGHIIHPHYYFNVAEAPNGSIWLLSSHGIYVIDHPEQVFDHPGQVRCVFDDIKAYSIVFDSEQRIWIGTTNDGIYLYDSTGTQQFDHFTPDNCLLASSEILDMTYDASRNTLWVSCLGGILSYTYDEFEYSTGSSGAYSYPDHLQAGSDEPLHILGLADHSEISVRNDLGKETHRVTAIGGTVTLPATQFTSGSYTIVGTDRQGHYGKIGTFTIE